ncbi:PREDICTED: ephrin type-B receptor 3-like isoform X2 [Amphimedon queenslandica]|uniref:Protein kinase domain-containing protein n=1 Tax=Amphimedon queenslandica TaxID=400682 RepID=A0AAN0IY34_AMPQE|nr:PREDICTED: ephrin type-B receptor 3-like isoform X2 [Amphimedon queenslandica]|eukprot:XP_019849351.1 PREDICTED: ephrin type-B receptor 3-like isoform X2 [Amphimedon queenslandica]
MTKRDTPDAGVSKTIEDVRTDPFTRTSSNRPDNTNTYNHHVTLTQSSPHTTPPPSSSSPVISTTSAGSSHGRSGSLLPIIIGSAVGVVGVLIGLCIGLLFVIVWLAKRRSLASTSNFGAAYRTCTPNRYIRKCVSSPLYEGTNLAKTTRAISATIIPLASSSQTSSLDSNHSSQSVSTHPQIVVCPRIIPPIAPPSPPPSPPPPPPPPPNFSPPPPSPRTPQGPPRVPPVSHVSPLTISSQYSLSRPPPPSLPLPSPPSTLAIPAERNPPTSPAMVGSPYEKEQRSKLFNGSVGYEFDDKLYKSLYDVQNVKDDGGESKDENKFFQESSEYWKPQKTTTAIYRQLASKRYREIPRHAIQITKYLGSGQFATVNKAQWITGGGDVSVAVKMLKAGSSEQEKVKFLQEAAINGQFHHLNVVRLLGVVTVGEPVIIVLELLGNGNLKKFLTSKRPVRGCVVPEELPNLLCNFCKQIASGMDYLAKKTFIHRDLAARNILVSEQLICKVADFGLSRDLQENEYYISQGGLVPIKWTALEAIFYRKYSTASDVWSYGVLLFEIWSLGRKPFSSLTNEKYIEKIDEGERLAPPPGCPRSFYQLMMDCWHPSPPDRPSFTSLCQYLSQPVESLLQLGISQVELEESPEASTLGAPIEAGQALFKDIQIRYLD